MESAKIYSENVCTKRSKFKKKKKKVFRCWIRKRKSAVGHKQAGSRAGDVPALAFHV